VCLEGLPGHVHLAANGETLGVVPAQPFGDVGDRPHLLGDVVAAFTVTPCRRPLVGSVLVDHLAGDTVELRLAEVRDVADGLADTLVERADVLAVAALVDRQHRRDVFDRLEFRDRIAADPPGGAVHPAEIERLLEFRQAGEQRVVGPVGDDRVGLDVVPVVVVADGLAELFGLLAGLAGAQLVDGREVGRRILDVGIVRRSARGSCHAHTFGRPAIEISGVRSPRDRTVADTADLQHCLR
jgi:hypothetical protein